MDSHTTKIVVDYRIYHGGKTTHNKSMFHRQKTTALDGCWITAEMTGSKIHTEVKYNRAAT